MFSEHTEQFLFQQQGLLLIPCKNPAAQEHYAK